MKTIVAFSDLHGRPIPERVRAVMGESDFIFFAGDGLLDAEYRLSDMKSKLYAVMGNCDCANAERELAVKVEDAVFLIVHGHEYHSEEELIFRAKELSADAVVYGHSHVFSQCEREGIRLINTGSLSHSPTGDYGYVFIAVNGKNIFLNFVKVG